MIAFVRGKVHSLEEEGLIIDLNGAGIMVLAPMAMLKPLPIIGEEIFLFTHMQIREDAWQLFGFPQREQISVFRHLIGVSGVGAKTALGILNTLTIGQIAAAVSHNDFNAFCAVPGIGKKTAQRLALELRDKVGSFSGEDVTPPGALAAHTDSDLLAALGQLGFSAAESRSLALRAFESLGQEAASDQLLKEALKLSARG